MDPFEAATAAQDLADASKPPAVSTAMVDQIADIVAQVLAKKSEVKS